MNHYQISLADPKAHLIKVELTIDKPLQPVQKLRLPNWIPGSYLIRDFAKNLVSITAQTVNGETVEISCIDKSNWEFKAKHKTVISYEVYAWDLSVRSAHFDETHAFFNGTSVFIEVVGQAEQLTTVNLQHNEFTKKQNWKVATGMPTVEISEDGFGHYKSENYQALIDYPFEVGNFTEINFSACGIPHRMVLTGIFELDEARLKRDLIQICEYELNLFGKPYPIEDYLFQVMVTGSDYGGLEHRNSTVLICSRNDLPYPGMDKPSDGYLQFLELCSHEYFHTWNVKRIQPEVYQTTDLQSPVYTNQLWWFEGITSYYDALILVRAGVIDSKTYLKLLAQQMTRVYRMPGRFKQSVAESSWLTWTKFYQQDENAPNAIISYYTKGSLVALALDLKIRKETANSKSLDNILLYLWENYGRQGKGLKEGEIENICSSVSGLQLNDFFADYLYAKADPDFAVLFAEFGIEFSLLPPSSLMDTGGYKDADRDRDALATFLGANVMETGSSLKVTHVWNHGSAYDAGIAANDEIIAMNGIKITSKSQLETLLMRQAAGNKVSCHYFRRDELKKTLICLKAPEKDQVYLQESSLELLKKWLLTN